MTSSLVKQMLTQMTPINRELERLSDVTKLSAHVTRILGQNPGMMTLQGTNSYLLQPPSNPLAPIILIDTSSPHTSTQYVDLLMTHLFHLGLESGTRETHFQSHYAENSLKYIPEDQRDKVKAEIIGERQETPHGPDDQLTEYGGPYGRWTMNATKERSLPPVEHIIITHRHLDHVGAIPELLKMLQSKGLPRPKIWKFPSPDEVELQADEKQMETADGKLIDSLPQGAYHPFSPFQPIHPVMPGLMISILDPMYKHLLKHDKDGKPKWNEVPEMARVSLRCLRTPGHTQDSISLVMLEGEKGVFTGDTVLGQGTTVFTDLASYMTSLKALLALMPSVLYPAHGPAITGQDKCAKHISQYISHRQEREDQIVEFLRPLAEGSTNLRTLVKGMMEKAKADAAKLLKENTEFYSGHPYKVPEKTPEQEEKDAKAQKELEREIERFPEDEKAVPIALIVRGVYGTNDDKVIWAAGKSIGAHMVKLEGEGKVAKKSVKMPKIIDGKIGEVEEQEGWEWIGQEKKEDAPTEGPAPA